MKSSRTARLGWLLVIAAALGGCAQLPQTPPPGASATVTAPTFKPGDTWTYAVHDGFTGLARGTLRHTVTAVDGNKVSLAIEQAGGSSIGCRTTARDNSLDTLPVTSQVLCGEMAKVWEITPSEWLRHPITNGSTYTFTPPYPAYEFPLSAGKQWSGKVQSHDLATGRNFEVSYFSSVVGWERVKVPAGEFDTIVIQRAVFDGFWDYTRKASQIREREWFAPALGRVVRKEGRSEYLDFLMCDRRCPKWQQDDWLVYELLPAGAAARK